MPIPATSTVFAGLEEDISQQQKHLQKQLDEIAKWKQLALIADNQTPTNPLNTQAHIKASTYYIGLRMPRNEDSSDENTPEQQAFKYALTSIEMAPPTAQRDAVIQLITLMDKIMDDLSEDNFDYYTFMLNKLGPRLDPSNQPLVIEWVIHNSVTREEDELRNIEEDTDPNAYVHSYDKTAISEVATRMLDRLYQEDRGFDYNYPLVGWLASLLPKDSPRYIGDFELPLNGKIVFAEAWAVPNDVDKDVIIFTDPETPEFSREFPDLFRHFVAVVGDPITTGLDRDAIIDTHKKIAATFAREAIGKGNHPTVQKALQSSLQMLRHYGIDE